MTTATPPVPPAVPAPPRPRRTLAAVALAGALLALAAWAAGPRVRDWLDAVSTDDAYVNGHVTTVAPRVAGQVRRVLVDDNKRVAKGDLLVELDDEPYRVARDQKQAAVETAEADLRAAESSARAAFAAARGQRWRLQAASEAVDNQAAVLSARVAALRSKEATLDRAKADLARSESLARTNAVSRQELDAATEAFKVADAAARQAAEEVAQARVALGLPPTPAKGAGLGDVPPDINQTHSSVRQALADLVQATAQVGLPLGAADSSPKQYLDEFRKLDAGGSVDRLIDKLVPDAPAVRQSRAKLTQARRDLAQAELNLRYCRVVAEIDGVVARRNVNPGSNVQAGQGVMAVRSTAEIWVDCHFKETQVGAMRVGHPVDLRVDAYPGRAFRGRVAGFAAGTGSTMSVLPAENATGNFVKVVQRLTVRVEFADPPPADAPLYAGLSVVPTVLVREPPEGPGAGDALPAPDAGGKP